MEKLSGKRRAAAAEDGRIAAYSNFHFAGRIGAAGIAAVARSVPANRVRVSRWHAIRAR